MNKIKSALIIDDNEDDRFIAESIIKRTGLCEKIFVSKNGLEAIEFLKDYEENREAYTNIFPPMLILLDINMPIMDGFSFLEEYSHFWEDQRYNDSVVCMFTTSNRPEDKQKAMQFPCVKDYLVKPMSKDRFSQVISDFF